MDKEPVDNRKSGNSYQIYTEMMNVVASGVYISEKAILDVNRITLAETAYLDVMTTADISDFAKVVIQYMDDTYKLGLDNADVQILECIVKDYLIEQLLNQHK